MTTTTRDLQRFSQDAFGVTYADPLDPNFTIRFKNSHARKNLNGVNTTNYVTEVICNDDVPVRLRDVDATDAVSVRVRVSGAFESQDRTRQVLKSLAAQLIVWADENVLSGFAPTTVPQNVVDA